MGHDKAAVQALQLAIRLAPGQVESYPRLALVLRHLQQKKDADDLMERMIRANSKSTKAHLLYTRYLYIQGSFVKAMEMVNRTLALAPDEPSALYMGGLCAVGRQRYEEAANFARRGIRAAKTDDRMYILLADVLLRMRQRADAIAALEQGLQATRGTAGYGDLLWHLANKHIDGGNPSEAQKCVEELRRINYLPPLVRCMEARIELARQQWLQARQDFESLRPDLTDYPQLLQHVEFWIGQCYGQAENVAQQLAAYRQALAIDPFFVPAHLAIAEVLVKSGRLTAAIDEYRQALKSGRPNEQVLLALAQTLIVRNLERERDQRNWDEVIQELKRAAEVAPDSPQVALLNLEVLIAQNRGEEAERLLTQWRDAMPERVEFWVALVLMAQRQEQWEKCEKLLAAAGQKLGDCVALRLVRAQYLFRRKGSAAAPEIRRLAEDYARFSDTDRVALWSALAPFCTQAKDYESALRLCQRVAAWSRPTRRSVTSCSTWPSAHSRQEPEQLAAELDKVLVEIERIAGRGPLWLHGQAVRLIILAKEHDPELLAQAQEYVARARKMRPDWSRLPLLAGGIYERQGKLDEAMENYLQALNMGEQNMEIVQRTVAMLRQRQRYRDADRLLSRLVEQKVHFTPELKKEYSEIAAQQADLEHAMEVTEKAVGAESQDYRDYLWHGQLLGVLARRAKAEHKADILARARDKAEQSLRRGLKLQPRSADCWVALIQLLADTDQREAARQAIEQARAVLPPAVAPWPWPTDTRRWAIWARPGSSFETPLTANPQSVFIRRQVADFYLRTENGALAEPLLRGLIQSSVKIPEPDLVWARRALVGLLKEHGDFPSLNEAMTLIEANEHSPFKSVDDQRAKTRLLLADPRRVKTREALQLLEEMVQSGELNTPDDRFDLAQLYLVQGQWLKYCQQMRRVLAADPPKPRHMAAYVRALLQHNESAEAELWLVRLEKAAPDQLLTVSLRADVLARNNHFSQAVETMMGFPDRPAAMPKGHWERVMMVAGVLEHLASGAAERGQKAAAVLFTEKADELFRSYNVQQPGNEMVLAGFLARQGRVKESLQLIDRYWTSAKPEPLGQAALDIIHGGSAGPEQIRQLQQVLQAALKKFHRPAGLLMTMADSCTHEEHYQEAEDYYREVAAKREYKAIALNNLGMLMAMRGEKLDNSLQLINQAIELAGPMAPMLDTRGVIYISMGDADKALADITMALNEDPTPVRIFHQARAYLLAGRKIEASAALQTAVRKSLKRLMLDPPERPIFDKLRAEL